MYVYGNVEMFSIYIENEEEEIERETIKMFLFFVSLAVFFAIVCSINFPFVATVMNYHVLSP